MFTSVVAWVAFCFGSLHLIFALLDTVFQFTLTKIQKSLGMSRHYFNGSTAFTLVYWFLAGWFLFG